MGNPAPKRPDGRQVEWRWIFVAEGSRGSRKAGARDIPDRAQLGGAARMTAAVRRRIRCPVVPLRQRPSILVARQIEWGAVVRWSLRQDFARGWNPAADLPDVSKCFLRLKRPCQRPFLFKGFLSLHGVVFDI